jgi:hypothetical protein
MKLHANAALSLSKAAPGLRSCRCRGATSQEEIAKCWHAPSKATFAFIPIRSSYGCGSPAAS